MNLGNTKIITFRVHHCENVTSLWTFSEAQLERIGYQDGTLSYILEHYIIQKESRLPGWNTILYIGTLSYIYIIQKESRLPGWNTGSQACWVNRNTWYPRHWMGGGDYIYILYIEEITIDTPNYTIYRNQYIYISLGWGGVGGDSL